MMLGDILTAAQRSGAGIETWLKSADPALWDVLRIDARRQDRSPAEIAQIAMAAFSDNAGEEDWTMMISKMRDDADPGRVLLITMIRWHLGVSSGGSASTVREKIG